MSLSVEMTDLLTRLAACSRTSHTVLVIDHQGIAFERGILLHGDDVARERRLVVFVPHLERGGRDFDWGIVLGRRRRFADLGIVRLTDGSVADGVKNDRTGKVDPLAVVEDLHAVGT